MRNLSIAVLLCSSFLMAQDFDADEHYSGDESSAVEESVSEPEPAVEDESSEESVAESYDSAPVEETPVAESEAPAPAEEPKLAGAATEAAPAKEPSIAPIYIPKELTAEQRVAAIQDNLDTLSNNMESTLLGKDDAPLAVSGYMAFRVNNFDYTELAPVYGDDRARTAVDATLKMNMVLMPNSYMTLWSNMTFPFDLTGLYTNYLAKKPNNNPSYSWERVMFAHNPD